MPGTKKPYMVRHLVSLCYANSRAHPDLQVGGVVSSLYHLRDPEESGFSPFFVFSDLGVRVEGVYRLKLTMSAFPPVCLVSCC